MLSDGRHSTPNVALPIAMRFLALSALVLGPGMSLSAQTRTVPPAVQRGLETITAADVRRRIEIIAHDSMGGRDTPSRGLDLTA